MPHIYRDDTADSAVSLPSEMTIKEVRLRSGRPARPETVPARSALSVLLPLAVLVLVVVIVIAAVVAR